jgi:iron(III) transport system substrate-binding protein
MRSPRLRGPFVLLVSLLTLALAATACGSGSDATTPAASDSELASLATMPMDQLYEQAKTEGAVTVYGGGSIIPELIPIFEKKYPGIKISNVDSTADDLVTRAVSEARGGRVLGDVWQTPMDTSVQMRQQKLLADFKPAEAEPYMDNLKGDYWVGTELQFLVVAWNTSKVSAADAPKGFEDLADPKWKGQLVADPRDAQLLMSYALSKYKDEQKAIDLFKGIAANEPQFHRGRREIAETLLPAGQASVCFTCNAHHFPDLKTKGAPVDFESNEGFAQIIGTSIFANAPHPKAGMLFARWLVSKEGQEAYANSSEPRSVAYPGIESEAPRPADFWTVSPEDFTNNLPRFEDTWNDIFNIR